MTKTNKSSACERETNMEKFTSLTSTVAVLPNVNIDTDQIIASDFLKVTNKDGLGKHLFAAWRYLENGDNNPDFVLNKPETRQAKNTYRW